MKLEDLQDELDADLKIDHIKLQYEAATIPTLTGKWIRKHSMIRKEMLRIENQKKIAIKSRLDYYTGRTEPGEEVCMDSYEKSEMKVVLGADKDILKVDTSLQYWAILLEFCSKALDAIKSKGFAIKHIIEMRHLEAGN